MKLIVDNERVISTVVRVMLLVDGVDRSTYVVLCESRQRTDGIIDISMLSSMDKQRHGCCQSMKTKYQFVFRLVNMNCSLSTLFECQRLEEQ
jgi:hypothetical protein